MLNCFYPTGPGRGRRCPHCTALQVSSAVTFLLSPGAQFISGATLRVDAGGSLYSPQLWQIPEHEKLPAYDWDPYCDTQE